MNETIQFIDREFTGERALFGEKNAKITKCVFKDGESPLKHGGDLEIADSRFCWKYPLWYCENVSVKNSVWEDGARAGVWYSKNVAVSDCVIDAPKNFRRCDGVALKNVTFTNSQETFWNCKNVTLSNVTVNNPYLFMNSRSVTAENLTVNGDYCFDGAKDIHIKNSRLISKDSFWNSENVTVENTYIIGEYLGWNSKNLTFINCTIESLQGLCYIENLKLINCDLKDTTLAFEYSSVDADISSSVKSVIDPRAGRITADHIDELIIHKDRVDESKTQIIIRDGTTPAEGEF